MLDPPATVEEATKKPILKESKLEVVESSEHPVLHEINDNALKTLRKEGGVMKLSAQVQACLRGSSIKHPQLLKSQDRAWTNPIGAALTLPGEQQGNIVCGICGSIRYEEDVSKKLKYGTHMCAPCAAVLTPLVFRKTGTKSLQECLECSGEGECVILPSNPNSCPACWLLLFLLGCDFPPKVFRKLDAMLPETLKKHPDSSPNAVLNAGKVLLCTQKHPLDGLLTEKGAHSVSSSSATSDEILDHFSHKNERRSVVTESLPNNWKKKAIRRVKGSHTGKWDVYLITPDQQVLRSQQQLKLFTAKTGAVIDTNTVNFSLPQRTQMVSYLFLKCFGSH